MAGLLRSALRAEMKERTEEILRAIRKVEIAQVSLCKADERLEAAIQKWIAFMDEAIKRLEKA